MFEKEMKNRGNPKLDFQPQNHPAVAHLVLLSKAMKPHRVATSVSLVLCLVTQTFIKILLNLIPQGN